MDLSFVCTGNLHSYEIVISYVYTGKLHSYEAEDSLECTGELRLYELRLTQILLIGMSTQKGGIGALEAYYLQNAHECSGTFIRMHP